MTTSRVLKSVTVAFGLAVGGAMSASPSIVTAAPIEERAPTLLADVNATGRGIFRSLLVTDTHAYGSARVNDPKGQDEFATLWQVDRSTGAATELIGVDADYGQIDVGAIVGDQLVVSGWSRAEGPDADHDPLVVVDVTTGAVDALDVPNLGPGLAQTMVAFDGQVYFQGEGDANGTELWRSDLTAAGTEPAADISSGASSSWPREFVVAPVDGGPDALFFRATTLDEGTELHRFDPATSSLADPTTIYDLNPGTANGQPVDVNVSTDGALYFISASAVGSARSHRLVPTATPATDLVEVLAPSDLTYDIDVFGSSLWEARNTGIFVTNAADEPGSLVKDVASVRKIAALSDGAVALANGVGGHDIWVTDGSDAGTEVATTGSVHGALFGAGDGSGALFRLGDQGEGVGREYWVSDGTVAGTRLVDDINTGVASQQYETVRPVDSGWIALASDPMNGQQLWEITTTTANRLSRVNVDQSLGSRTRDFIEFGDDTWFSAETETHGTEWWRHDRETGEVTLVIDLAPGEDDGVGGTPLLLGDRVAFVGEPDGDDALYLSDGTAAGTTQVTVVGASNGASYRDEMVVGDRFVFTASDEFFVLSAGSTTATRLGSFDVDDVLGVAGGQLIALGFDGVSEGLFAIDPTTGDATLLVADIEQARWPTSVAGSLYMAVEHADAPGGGGDALVSTADTLIRTDGTAENTVGIAGLRDVPISRLVANDDRLIAISDGTRDGEELVAAADGDGEFALYTVDGADSVTSVEIPAGDPVLELDDSDHDPVRLDGDVVLIVRRGDGDGGVGRGRSVDGEAGVTSQLVTITDGVWTVREESTTDDLRLAGVYDGYLYFTSEKLEDEYGLSNLAPTPEGSVRLHRTDGTPNSAATLFDYDDFGFERAEARTIAGDVLYGRAVASGAGEEPVVLHLGDEADPDPDPDPDPVAEVVSLTPGRVFASRVSDETVDGLFEGGGRIEAGEFVEVDIAGRAGVADDAKSVVMNITAINPSGRGYVTTYPCETRPLASSLNYGAAGAVVGNELVAKLSGEGAVCVFSSAETDLSIDVVGYVPASSAVTPLDPGRVYATRASDETVDGVQEATGRIPAGEFVEVDLAGRAGVPSSGAGSVVMNITAINPSGRGYSTVYPCGDRPLASSLNYGAAGAVVGNELIAKLSDGGTVCVFSSAETDLTVDVVGYIQESSAATSLDPARVYATRASDETVDGEQEATGQIAAGEFVEVEIAGRAGVPASAGAVVMNITAINPTGRGYITTYPCETRPLASSLNYGAAGAVVGNELVAKLSTDGTVCVFSSAATDLTVDVVGYIPA
jgi:ELWxxDGT repeat protein